MKNMFGIHVMALSLFSIILVSCNSSSSKKEKAPGKKIFISSFMTMHDPFFVSLNEGITKAVIAHGDSLVFLDGNELL
jgi:ABC-type sugar transport system substrate-binding protein